MVDTKTLVVGQDVSISSGGFYYNRGKVVEVSPSGVGVHVPNMGCVLRFDSEGKGCDANQTPECGRWYIDDIPPRSAS